MADTDKKIRENSSPGQGLTFHPQSREHTNLLLTFQNAYFKKKRIDTCSSGNNFIHIIAMLQVRYSNPADLLKHSAYFQLIFIANQHNDQFVNATNADGATPLMLACLYGNIHIVWALLQCNNASLDQVDKIGPANKKVAHCAWYEQEDDLGLTPRFYGVMLSNSTFDKHIKTGKEEASAHAYEGPEGKFEAIQQMKDEFYNAFNAAGVWTQTLFLREYPALKKILDEVQAERGKHQTINAVLEPTLTILTRSSLSSGEDIRVETSTNAVKNHKARNI